MTPTEWVETVSSVPGVLCSNATQVYVHVFKLPVILIGHSLVEGVGEKGMDDCLAVCIVHIWLLLQCV